MLKNILSDDHDFSNRTFYYFINFTVAWIYYNYKLLISGTESLNNYIGCNMKI